MLAQRLEGVETRFGLGLHVLLELLLDRILGGKLDLVVVAVPCAPSLDAQVRQHHQRHGHSNVHAGHDEQQDVDLLFCDERQQGFLIPSALRSDRVSLIAQAL